MHAIAIHGGAGAMPRSEITAEAEARYREGLAAALDAGASILDGGGSSLDAVTAAVRTLEDDPLFNAGRGAVLTRRGRAELDASIMSGRNLNAGAVACIEHVKNPIELARRVMERSRHVLLVGQGAEEFALEEGLVLVPNEYFRTPERERALHRALHGERTWELIAPPHGTVGAVALDEHGDLAAATSTGGTTRKRPGRVGDSPVIGAGTYARNGVCAVSATGYGEYFIRTVAAYDVCAQVEYGRRPLAEAVSGVLREKIGRMGGDGGIIAVAADGAVVVDFNTEGMFRAVLDARGRREIALFA